MCISITCTLGGINKWKDIYFKGKVGMIPVFFFYRLNLHFLHLSTVTSVTFCNKGNVFFEFSEIKYHMKKVSDNANIK